MDVDLCSFLVVPGLILLPSVLGGNRKLPKNMKKKIVFQILPLKKFPGGFKKKEIIPS